MTAAEHIAAIRTSFADAEKSGAQVAVSMRKLDEYETAAKRMRDALAELLEYSTDLRGSNVHCRCVHALRAFESLEA